MDAFSLLKFWRSGGGGFGGSRALTGRAAAGSTAPSGDSSSGTTTIFASPPESDGPFIDLEFTTVPEEEGGEIKGRGNDDGEKADQCKNSQHAVDDDDDGSGSDESYGENEEGVLNLTFSTSSGSSVDRTDPDSSDDICFFNAGGLFPIESSGANSKFPASLATKFRVLMLKLKKPRANAEKSESGGTNPAERSQKDEDEEDESHIQMEKTVRFTFEEMKFKSLFNRDASSKNRKAVVEQKSDAEGSHSNVDSSSSSIIAEEKKFSREMVEKYLNFVRPYVSKRYGENKLGVSGQLSLKEGESTTAGKAERGETDPAKIAEKSAFSSTGVKQGLRVVREHLIKSRSAPSPVVSSGQWSSRRRDDSLLQQQDGIQGAILHCKRSFHSTRG